MRVLSFRQPAFYLCTALDEIAQETKYGVDVYHGRVEAKSEAEQERACSAILAHCAVASTTEEAVSEYPGLLFDMGHILPPAIVSAATGDEHDQQRAARVIRANVMYAAHHRDIEIPDSPSLAPAVYNTMDSMSLLTLGK